MRKKSSAVRLCKRWKISGKLFAIREAQAAWLQMREQQKATQEEIKAGKEADHEREIAAEETDVAAQKEETAACLALLAA